MTIKQITVFLENKAGALLNVTKVLAKNNVDLRAINIAETADYGLLRLITADNTLAEQVLKDEGYIFTKTRVLAIAVDDKAGALNSVLEILASADINLHYMYSIFGQAQGKAYMIMQVEEVDKAKEVLIANGINIACASDLRME